MARAVGISFHFISYQLSFHLRRSGPEGHHIAPHYQLGISNQYLSSPALHSSSASQARTQNKGTIQPPASHANLSWTPRPLAKHTLRLSHQDPWPHHTQRTQTSARSAPPSQLSPLLWGWCCPTEPPGRHTKSHLPLCSDVAGGRPHVWSCPGWGLSIVKRVTQRMTWAGMR